VEENEYKSTYKTLTTIRCVFEKALTNHRASCHLSKHFCLADREGYACQNEQAASRCRDVLEKIREKSAFVLKLHDVDAPLPHNMEIRVQVGGLTGLVKTVVEGDEPEKSDIDNAMTAAIEHFGSVDKLPYSEIMQSVVKFQGRCKRQR
jgi:hypothetical protein